MEMHITIHLGGWGPQERADRARGWGHVWDKMTAAQKHAAETDPSMARRQEDGTWGTTYTGWHLDREEQSPRRRTA